MTDLLDELYQEFGVYDEMNTALVLEGAEGAAKIKALTGSYSAQPPTRIDGSPVAKVQDFSKEDVYDEEGDLIPKTGMLMVHLEDGRRFAVRPSGTEPKIKFYLFGKGEPEPANLESSKAAVRESLETLWSWLESDAYSRKEAMTEQ